jgi:predicted nucleic acid-binding protein
VIDTSVLVAGISGFKSGRAPGNPSAEVLRDWLENATFTWLITEDILAEYKEVLTRLALRRNLIGEIINLLREEAELVNLRVTANQTRTIMCFALAPSRGVQPSLRLLTGKTFLRRDSRLRSFHQVIQSPRHGGHGGRQIDCVRDLVTASP